jgi:hypothetical protein
MKTITCTGLLLKTIGIYIYHFIEMCFRFPK